MNKFEIGDKAIFIRSNAGNEGKIVEVVDFFNQETDTMYDHHWKADVVVKTLGSPLNTLLNDEAHQHLIIPCASSFLRKLPKVDEDQPALTEYIK